MNVGVGVNELFCLEDKEKTGIIKKEQVRAVYWRTRREDWRKHV